MSFHDKYCNSFVHRPCSQSPAITVPSYWMNLPLSCRVFFNFTVRFEIIVHFISVRLHVECSVQKYERWGLFHEEHVQSIFKISYLSQWNVLRLIQKDSEVYGRLTHEFELQRSFKIPCIFNLSCCCVKKNFEKLGKKPEKSASVEWTLQVVRYVWSKRLS